MNDGAGKQAGASISYERRQTGRRSEALLPIKANRHSERSEESRHIIAAEARNVVTAYLVRLILNDPLMAALNLQPRSNHNLDCISH